MYDDVVKAPDDRPNANRQAISTETETVTVIERAGWSTK